MKQKAVKQMAVISAAVFCLTFLSGCSEKPAVSEPENGTEQSITGDAHPDSSRPEQNRDEDSSDGACREPEIRHNKLDISGFSDPAHKNSGDLAVYAVCAWKNKWGYVWGTFGQVLTPSLLEAKQKQYPGGVGSHAAFIRAHWLGGRTTDCTGLIKGYGWLNPDTLEIEYGSNGMPDVTCDRMFDTAEVSGPIETIPEIPGLAVWRSGHIGVYIGNGDVIEARGTAYGVVRTRLADRDFTHWMKIPYITYPTAE